MPKDPITVEVFENQRYYPFGGWSSKTFPTEWKQWSDNRGKAKPKESFKCPVKMEWGGDWEIERNELTDPDGWGYAVIFPPKGFARERFKPASRKGDFVRTRRWTRQQIPIKVSGRGKATLADRRAKAAAEDARRQNNKNRSGLFGKKKNKGGFSGNLEDYKDPDEFLEAAHQDNMNSLANCMAMMSDADALADKNVAKLRAQTEQMKDVDQTMDDMNQDLDKSDRLLTSIGSGFFQIKGKMQNAFKSTTAKAALEQKEKKNKEEAAAAAAAKAQAEAEAVQAPAKQPVMTKGGKKLTDKQARREARRRRKGRTTKVEAELYDIQTVPRNKLEQKFDRHVEVENEQLDALSGMLDGVLSKSKDMSKEIDRQTVYVDHLGKRTDKLNRRMRGQTDTMKKQLRK